MKISNHVRSETLFLSRFGFIFAEPNPQKKAEGATCH